MTGPRDFRYLCAGIDTLDLGLYVDWQSHLVDIYPQLDHQRDRAREGKTPVWRHDVVGEALVFPSAKRNYRWTVQLRDATLWLANNDTPNRFPNVYASPSAESLWTKGPAEAVEGLTAMLAELGAQVMDVQVSRADLAADFALPDGLTLEFLRHHRVSRVRKTNQHEDDGVLQTYYVAQRGAPLQARIYNKLLKATVEPRTAFILAIWGGPVPGWRVEFQLRRQILRSFGISTLDDLRTKAGGLCQYLTDSWLSFRLDDAGHTRRRTVHPWWQAVQACAADFGPACTLSREADNVPKAPTDWYVSHMAGCLVPFAAREGLRSVDAALKAFDEKARAHWAERCW